MQQMIIPPALRPGSVVGLFCLGGYTSEDKILLTKAAVEAMGYKAYIHPQCYLQHGYFAGTDLERAAALNEMFAAPQIDAIFAVRGGHGSFRLLDKIDYNLIAQHPKIFMGMSDATAIQWAITSKVGLITFSGPNSKVWEGPKAAQCQQWVKATLENNSRQIITANATTHRAGTAEGQLWGGNLSVIGRLLASGIRPQSQQPIISFYEDLYEFTTRLDSNINTFRLSGLLPQSEGILLGEFIECRNAVGHNLTVPEIFEEALQSDIPIIENLPFGHGDLHCVIPIGAQARLTATPDSVTLELLHDVVKTS